jgi:hypothetical protein
MNFQIQGAITEKLDVIHCTVFNSSLLALGSLVFKNYYLPRCPNLFQKNIFLEKKNYIRA